MTSADMSAKRRKLLSRLAIFVLVALSAGYLWHTLIGSRSVSTDNAYVGADSAEIMPLVSGQVMSVNVRETQTVKAGDVLLTIDRADAEIKLRQAQAALDQARRTILQARSMSDALSATVRTAEADLARTTSLAAKGNASQQSLQHDEDALRAAEAQLEANQNIAGEGEVDAQPTVLAAKAAVDQAALDLDRTTIKAPIDGVIAKRNVQVGQYVEKGTPVLAVVPIYEAYVDANFKELQLAQVRVGQPVEMISDLYGSRVVFHGKVVGLGGGTGSAFALIPAQNATGNWIKIVQRLPVRVSLDPAELEQHPLRVGLSMEATVDLTSAGD